MVLTLGRKGCRLINDYVPSDASLHQLLRSKLCAILLKRVRMAQSLGTPIVWWPMVKKKPNFGLICNNDFAVTPNRECFLVFLSQLVAALKFCLSSFPSFFFISNLNNRHPCRYRRFLRTTVRAVDRIWKVRNLVNKLYESSIMKTIWQVSLFKILFPCIVFLYEASVQFCSIDQMHWTVSGDPVLDKSWSKYKFDPQSCFKGTDLHFFDWNLGWIFFSDQFFIYEVRCYLFMNENVSLFTHVSGDIYSC